MIKGKPSYPFETIALALAFSPRLEALIAETGKLARQHNARVVFIHVGKKTSDKVRLLTGLLSHYGFNDGNSKVLWEQGNPVEAILAACKHEVVDLLVIGALEKENVLKYYMGSVSREISRRAKCSVLMLTRPRVQPVPFRKIIVNGHDHPKTYNTLLTALYAAEKEEVREVTLVHEIEIPELSLSMAEDSLEPDMEKRSRELAVEDKIRIESLLYRVKDHPVKVKQEMISGRSGFTLARYAQQQMADLLVVNSPEHHLSIFDRIFTHDLEYMLSDMPCNMLVVHTRGESNS